MIVHHDFETSVGFCTNDFQEVEYWGCKKDYDRRYQENLHSNDSRAEALAEYIKRK